MEAVEKGLFREDLFYRLHVLPIEIPPLRERREDIPLLIDAFIKDYEEEYNNSVAVDPEALALLQAYTWPGNVRELKNVITRLCIMAVDNMILPLDLPENIVHYGSEGLNFEWLSSLQFKEAKEKWLEGFEVKYIEYVLRRYGGNISEAARNSGVNRKTFQRLISKHQIDTGKILTDS